MVVAIHRDTAYVDRYGEQWAARLEERGIAVRWVDLTARDALAQVTGCDGAMWRFGHLPEDMRVAPRVLAAIEQVLGIPCFPDRATAWHYDDKVSQYYLLAGAGFAMPPTWIFWDAAAARRWAAGAAYPKVFKLSAGSSGANVLRIESAVEAHALIDRMFGHGIPGGLVDAPALPPRPARTPRTLVEAAARRGRAALRALRGVVSAPPPSRWSVERGYAYFQEWLPDQPFDTRVFVIGERAFAYRRYPYPGDFRASRSGGPRDYDPAGIDPRMLQLCFAISRRLGFQSMAYDLMLHRGDPVVLEMSYTFGVGRHQCAAYWTPDLERVERDVWPYTAQVEDFVRRIEARRPKPAGRPAGPL
ncbi:MAG: ATP-grasp domain-containing protein, partial [Candidatus Rokuibacteriota bacterium]